MRKISTPGEMLAACTLVGALLFTLGWRRYNPEAAIVEEAKTRRLTDSIIDARITYNARRIDSLASQLWFTNFLQCTAMTPATRPEACRIILQRGPVQ